MPVLCTSLWNTNLFVLTDDVSREENVEVRLTVEIATGSTEVNKCHEIGREISQ
jgi:hypothetical protein